MLYITTLIEYVGLNNKLMTTQYTSKHNACPPVSPTIHNEQIKAKFTMIVVWRLLLSSLQQNHHDFHYIYAIFDSKNDTRLWKADNLIIVFKFLQALLYKPKQVKICWHQIRDLRWMSHPQTTPFWESNEFWKLTSAI